MEEAKPLIRLNVVDSYHFTKYRCKITHCINSQTLSEYISAFFLGDNEKLSILIGIGTFTSTSSFDTQSLEFVITNKLKKPIPGGL